MIALMVLQGETAATLHAFGGCDGFLATLRPQRGYHLGRCRVGEHHDR
jgi:hypothetical protein